MNSLEILSEIRDAIIYAREDVKSFSSVTSISELKHYRSGQKDATEFVLRKVRRLSVKLHKEQNRNGSIFLKLFLIKDLINEIKNAVIPFPSNDFEMGKNSILTEHYNFFTFLYESYDEPTPSDPQ